MNTVDPYLMCTNGSIIRTCLNSKFRNSSGSGLETVHGTVKSQHTLYDSTLTFLIQVWQYSFHFTELLRVCSSVSSQTRIVQLHSWVQRPNIHFMIMDSNLGKLLTFEVDWRFPSKEYFWSLSQLHPLLLPGTWNQPYHSVQTAQTLLHPGSKNSGGPVSLVHLLDTLPSGCIQ